MDLRIFTEPQQGATYDDQLAVARTAESAGFSAFFRSDHFLAMGVDGAPGPTDAWTTLAGLARETSTIRLGTLVSSATFRSPGILAVQVAQVDEMSGGRVELGLGAGWFEAEHAAYAIGFPPLGERFERLAEQLEIVTGLWGTPVGDRYAFDGRHFQVKDSPALPKPVQQRVPVIIGGAGAKKTPALAARFATEFNANFMTPERSAEQFARVRQACEAIGRDPGELTYSSAFPVCVGGDDAEVARRAAATGQDLADLRAGGVAGSPAEAVDALGRHAEAGSSRAYLQVLDLADLEHIELIGAEVLPQVR